MFFLFLGVPVVGTTGVPVVGTTCWLFTLFFFDFQFPFFLSPFFFFTFQFASGAMKLCICDENGIVG